MTNGNGKKSSKLPSKLSREPLLKHQCFVLPRDEGQYKVEADASNFATGAVLSQLQDKEWHPIAFQSQSLSEAERNYDIYDKELLAIVRALEEWRHHLEGADERFEVWTDHKNLTYFREAQKTQSSTVKMVLIPFTLRI